MSNRLENKVALITGAARGIGAAVKREPLPLAFRYREAVEAKKGG